MAEPHGERLERINALADAIARAARVDRLTALKVAGLYARAEKRLYGVVDAKQVLNEIIDSLDPALTPGENAAVAESVIARYIGPQEEVESPVDLDRSQLEEARARFEDLLFKREWGLTPEEEEELRALEAFLRAAGALKREERAAEWTEVLSGPARVELEEVEAEVYWPERVVLLKRLEKKLEARVRLL